MDIVLSVRNSIISTFEAACTCVYNQDAMHLFLLVRSAIKEGRSEVEEQQGVDKETCSTMSSVAGDHVQSINKSTATRSTSGFNEFFSAAKSSISNVLSTAKKHCLQEQDEHARLRKAREEYKKKILETIESYGRHLNDHPRQRIRGCLHDMLLCEEPAVFEEGEDMTKPSSSEGGPAAKNNKTNLDGDNDFLILSDDLEQGRNQHDNEELLNDLPPPAKRAKVSSAYGAAPSSRDEEDEQLQQALRMSLLEDDAVSRQLPEKPSSDSMSMNKAVIGTNSSSNSAIPAMKNTDTIRNSHNSVMKNTNEIMSVSLAPSASSGTAAASSSSFPSARGGNGLGNAPNEVIELSDSE